MRVLLPLKKKLEQHEDYDDSDSDFSSSSSDIENEEQQQQLYYTVDESELVVNEGSLKVPAVEESSCHSPAVVLSKTSPSVASGAAAADQTCPGPDVTSPEVSPYFTGAAENQALSHSSVDVQDCKAPAVSGSTASLKVASLPQQPSISSASVSEHDNCNPPAVLTPLKVSSVAVAAPPTGSPSSPRVTPGRKRRSPSPPLDSKPAPIKNSRRNSPADSKPPAVPLTSDQQERKGNIMAGGRRILNREDSAELDVRYTYFPPENDPASARGDVPSASFSSHTTPNLRVTNHSGGNTATTAPAAATVAMARDDDEDDAREPATSSTSSSHAAVSHAVGPVINSFAAALKKKGLEMVEQEGDGNCLFRAISLQVYGDASMHEEVRHRCLDFMVSLRDERFDTIFVVVRFSIEVQYPF